MALSLRRNAVWMLAGQLGFAACHWLGLVVLGRLGGPEELGRYGLALAVVTPIMLLSGLQMREIQVADATRRHPFSDYLAVRLVSTLGGVVVVVALALIAYSWPMVPVILLLGLAWGFMGLSDVHYGLAQRHRRLDLVAQSMLLRGVLGLVALGAGYQLTRSLEVALGGMVAASALVWWRFDWRRTSDWPDPPGSARSREATLRARLRLAWRGVPLGIALMLVSLNPNVPRYFIDAMVGLGALGLFAAMAHFIVAGRMLVGAVCQAASPRLADLYAAGELAAFRWLVVRLMGVGLVVGLAGLLVALAFGRELLGLIYGPAFAEGADVFVWIMVVGVVALVQTPLGYGLTAMQQFGVQPVIFGLAAVVNVVCCLLLIPGYGLLGATFGWLGAVLCQLLLSLAVHWRGLRRPGLRQRAPAGG